MSVPSRARLLCQCPSGPGYYVSTHQDQVIMSLPIRARLLCQCPSGPGYYVSVHQGQVIMSVPGRARNQCPAGPTAWLVWVTASIAVVSAPHQSNIPHGCARWSIGQTVVKVFILVSYVINAIFPSYTFCCWLCFIGWEDCSLWHWPEWNKWMQSFWCSWNNAVFLVQLEVWKLTFQWHKSVMLCSHSHHNKTLKCIKFVQKNLSLP